MESADLNINLGPDESFCPFIPRVLTPLQNSLGYEFLWRNGSTQPTFTATEYGTCWVTVSDGCKVDRDTITYSKQKEEFVDLFIPNVITPNNDSKNQFFIIDAQLTGSYLAVYNRWGKQVYESSNYQNNWDGRDLPVGMYYYYIMNSCTENMKGFLSIIR